MTIFDPHTIFAMAGVAVVGSLIGLDRTAAGQFMVSQPLVAAPLTGWMLGDVSAGLIIGAILELIWVLDMPVGTFVPADATINAVSATTIVVLAHPGGAALSAIGFGLILSVGTIPLTMRADAFVRKNNSRLVDRACPPRGGDAARSLSRAHLSGLVAFFLKSFFLYALFLPLGFAAAVFVVRMPALFHHAMERFVTLLPLLGAALVLRRLSVKTLDPFLLTGFASAALFGLVFQLPVGMTILLTIVMGWMGVRFSEHR